MIVAKISDDFVFDRSVDRSSQAHSTRTHTHPPVPLCAVPLGGELNLARADAVIGALGQSFAGNKPLWEHHGLLCVCVRASVRCAYMCIHLRYMGSVWTHVRVRVRELLCVYV